MNRQRTIFSNAICIVVVLLLIFSTFKTSIFAAGPVFVDVKENSTSLKKYEKFELTIKLNADYSTPFRADVDNENFRDVEKTPAGYGVLLDAVFVSPSGKAYKVPGYWDVDYKNRLDTLPEKQYFAVNSGSHWHVRFSPKEEGKYRYYLELKDKNGASRYPAAGVKEFNTSSETNPLWPHGGIKKSTSNPGYLEYEDGTPYTQFGITGVKSNEAESLLQSMNENGGNFLRKWLTNGAEDSIFRKTGSDIWNLNDSSTLKRGYASDAHYGSGKDSLKSVAANAGSGTELISQGSIGVLSNTCYSASMWAKTSSDFSGSFYIRAKDEKGYSYNGSAINSLTTEWKKISATFKTRSIVVLNLNAVTNAITKGTIWFDEVSLIETAQNADGTCSSTPKYGSDTVNSIWDPSFEMAQRWSMGNPSNLNMLNLARFEYALSEAEENNTVIQPCIFDYRVWGNLSSAHSNWSDFFHYEKASDSDTAQVYNFFTDSMSKKYAKYALRYLIARFSYSPALGIWELENEMDKAFSQDRYDWISEMSKYLKDNDYNGHLVTASYWGSPGASQFEHISTIDVNSVHFYINDDSRNHDHLDPSGQPWTTRSNCKNSTVHEDEYNWAIRVLVWANQNDRNQDYDGDIGNHIILSGEFGLMGDEENWNASNPSASYCSTGRLSHWAWPNDTTQYKKPRVDSGGLFYHNGIWAMLMANGFKSSVSNWFDEPLIAWHYETQYKGPSIFAKTLPFRDGSSQIVATNPDAASTEAYKVADTIIASSSNSDIRTLGRKKDNQAFLWIQNKNNTWSKRIKDGQSISEEKGIVTVPNFSAGTYKITYFDTVTGAIDKTAITSATSGGNVDIETSLLTSKPDIAVQITKENEVPRSLIENISVTSGKNYVVSKLGIGGQYYIDRSYTISALPKYLINAEWIKTANDDKKYTNSDFLKFNLSKEADVYIAYDQRLTVPSWLKDWQKMPDTAAFKETAQRTVALYKKHFLAGQIVLGANNGVSESSMYAVAAVPGTAESLEITTAANVANPHPHDQVIYTIKVKNPTSKDQSIALTDPIESSSLIIQSVDKGGRIISNTGSNYVLITWPQISLKPGQEETYTVVTEVR